MEGPSSFYWQHHRPTRMVAIETNSYWDVWLHTATKSILRVMQGNALTAQVNSTNFFNNKVQFNTNPVILT